MDLAVIVCVDLTFFPVVHVQSATLSLPDRCISADGSNPGRIVRTLMAFT